MSSDPNDELARARARREAARRLPRPDAVDHQSGSTEQDEALARARESWALSQLGREGRTRRDPDMGAPGDTVEDVGDTLSDD